MCVQNNYVRTVIAAAIVGVCAGPAPAQDGLPSAAVQVPFGRQFTAMLPNDFALTGDNVIFASAGAVFAAISLNYMSGGAIGAVFGIGRSTATTATLITFALTEMAWFATDVGLGPAVVYGVGQPIDAALRDGYTTPTTLAAAFAERGRRAGAIAMNAGAYVGATVEDWWNQL